MGRGEVRKNISLRFAAAAARQNIHTFLESRHRDDLNLGQPWADSVEEVREPNEAGLAF